MLPTQSQYALAPWRRRILWTCFVLEIALVAFWIAKGHTPGDLSRLFFYLSLPIVHGAILLPRSLIALHYVLVGIGFAMMALSVITR